jgi:DNA mismatch repair protein MutL
MGRPEAARKTRGEQFIFVNQRFIRNNYLGHAVSSAFEGLLPDNSFPFYVLFIEIDPKHIDVNVHPTKTEIKFDDERAVYAVVRSAVKQALGAHNLSPALDFIGDVNMVNKLNSSQPLTKEQYYDEQFGTSLQRSNLNNWEKLFEGEETNSRLFSTTTPEPKVSMRFESSMNREEQIPVTEVKPSFQLHQKYIVREVKNGLMIIDQQSAHERVLFEKYMLQLKGNPGSSQQSLFPQAISFSASDFALVMEMEQEIKTLGFRFEVFGKNTLQVSGIPTEASGNEKTLFEGLVEQFKRNQSELSIPLRENLAQSLAKRTAIKTGQKLLKEEMDAIVQGLFACNNPNFSPEGKPTFFIFDSSKIENYFTR